LIACVRLRSFRECFGGPCDTLHDDLLIAQANSMCAEGLSNSLHLMEKFNITAEDMCDYPDLRLLLDLLETHLWAFSDEVNRTRTKGRQSHKSFF
jgi:hypothetical protein